tara:strand:- start:41 stop:892 length:852 start_codon:yes stop_codon:yes gene_type:complete
MKTKFIAEISSNHNQNLKRCFKFIDLCSDLNFYAVKFQLFKVKDLFHKKVLKRSKSHRDRKNWELPINFLPKISSYCKRKRIKFACTPFYLKAVDELNPYVDFYKISSYEILYSNLLAKCALTNKPVIFSSGMADFSEVKNAYNVLKNNNCKKISILHCVSNYPARIRTCNLNAIKFLSNKLKCDVGWSDHTANPLVVYEAIQNYKAKYVELHIDLDQKGYEYKFGHCWLPRDLENLFSFMKYKSKLKGKYNKKYSLEEKVERNSRADPYDGLRPLIKLRKKL